MESAITRTIMTAATTIAISAPATAFAPLMAPNIKYLKTMAAMNPINVSNPVTSPTAISPTPMGRRCLCIISVALPTAPFRSLSSITIAGIMK
ncbi:MAG: hypothetical protein KKA10_08555 [Euryarchaeota archaeon]|nr:hypothetical protein [Euryarchaeota archaeon]MCG2737050.1 hypothetical protein [Candidatus Methanoperedenaceae archaeon]